MKKRVLVYVLCYCLWVITLGLGILDLIMARHLSLVILVITPINPWARGAVDKFSLVIFGIILLILFIFSEYYYREGVAKKKLWERFSLITAGQLFFLSFAHLALPLIQGLSWLDWRSFLLAGGELGSGIIFSLIAARSRFGRGMSIKFKQS